MNRASPPDETTTQQTKLSTWNLFCRLRHLNAVMECLPCKQSSLGALSTRHFWKCACKLPHDLPFPQAKTLSPPPHSACISTPPQHSCPSPHMLQPLNAFVPHRGPQLHTALQLRPQRCPAQATGHCPAPAAPLMLTQASMPLAFLATWPNAASCPPALLQHL